MVDGPSSRKRRVFIEASVTFRSVNRTGIQRVVRNIVEPLVLKSAPPRPTASATLVPVTLDRFGIYELSSENLKPIPPGMLGSLAEQQPRSSIRQGLLSAAAKGARLGRKIVTDILPSDRVHEFMYAPRWRPGLAQLVARALHSLPGLRTSEAFAPMAAQLEQPRRLVAGADYALGDVLILLDSSWDEGYWRVLAKLKQSGVRCVFVIYDLIPILDPDVVRSDLRAVFRPWLLQTLKVADGYLTISNAVAEELRTLLSARGATTPVGTFPLGADILPAAREQSSQDPLSPEADPFYLMVGTLEPRKRHLMVLDAFERLWRSAPDLKLVIAGKWGWLSKRERSRLERHRELGRRLVHLDGVDDAELQSLYARSRAVIQASRSEGYGLPIIEAAFHGKRVICTDLPVFREVAPPGTIFFEKDSVQSLVDAIAHEWSLPPSAPVDRSSLRLKTWNDSRDELIEQALRLVQKA